MKISKPAILSSVNVHTNLYFSKSHFQVKTNIRTDKQTNKTHNVAYHDGHIIIVSGNINAVKRQIKKRQISSAKWQNIVSIVFWQLSAS